MRLPRRTFCFLLIIGVVAVLLVHRRFLTVQEYPRLSKSCLALLHSGKLINGSFWKPDGCSLHWYTEKEAAACFKARLARGLTNHFAFIGDSRMRYLSFEFMVRFGFKKPKENPKLHGMGDYSVECPHKELPGTAVRYVADMLLTRYAAKPTRQHEPPPTLIVGGIAIWYMVDNFYAPVVRLANMTLSQRLELYKEKVAAWAQDGTTFLNDHPKSKILWILQEPLGSRKPPFYNLTNYKMDLFNEGAEVALKPFENVHIWRTARIFNIAYNRSGHDVLNDDPIHIRSEVIDYQLQMLMNLVCNKYIVGSLEEDPCCTESDDEMTVRP